MYFIFDTETNGMGTNNHCISIGYLIVGKDMRLKEKGYKLFCRNDLTRSGWNPHAQKVHGITWRESQDKGLDPAYEWPKIFQKMSWCNYAVAHNIKFDWGVVENDIKRFQLKHPQPIGKICTLEISRKLWRGRRNDLKSVFNRIHLGKDFDKIFKHHEALSDARACANIFHKMHKNGFIKLEDYGK